jgi:hypothetical protein
LTRLHIMPLTEATTKRRNVPYAMRFLLALEILHIQIIRTVVSAALKWTEVKYDWRRNFGNK